MKKLLFAAMLLTAGMVGHAQSLDEIVTKHVAAMGGADNLAKVTSTVVTGEMSVQGAEVGMLVTTVQGKAARADISVMGTSNYMIYTPTQGWRYMPIQQITSVEPMTEAQVKAGADNLETVSLLYNYKEKGSKLELLGTEDVDGTMAHKLKVTLSNGTAMTLFLDSKTFLIVRSISMDNSDGSEKEVTKNYGNYKAVDGVMFAHSFTFGPAELNVSKVEINKAVDMKIFKPE